MKRKFLLFGLIAFLAVGLTACGTSNSSEGRVIKENLSQQKNFNSIRVNAGTSNVKLIASKHFKAYFCGPDKVKPKVSVKKGTLIVKQKIKSFDMTSNTNSNIIKLYLPKKLISSVSIQAANGNITSDGLINAKHVNINSSNGNVTIANLKTIDGVVNAGDGNVIIKRLLSTEGLNAYASTGNITVDKSNSSGYNLDSNNGKVTINAGKSSINGTTKDSGNGGSYRKNLLSKNVLHAVSDSGNVTVK